MKKNNRTGWLIAVIIMGLMAAASEWTGKEEILFPEMAALVTGSFLMEQRPWNVLHIASTAEMTVCALMGVLISRYAAVPLYFKMLLAVVFVLALFVVSRVEMSPAISACTLPVLLQKTDWIYVAAVLIMALACDLGNLWMEKSSRMKTKEFQPKERNLRLLYLVLPAFAIALTVPMLTGFRFMTAPPLIVAFVTLCGQGALTKNRPPATIFLFSVEAWIGFFCRTLAELSGLSPVLFIVISAVLAWMVMVVTKHPFPPASAIAVLPFLLPAEGLWKYPLEVMAGISVFYLMAFLVSKLSRVSAARTEM